MVEELNRYPGVREPIVHIGPTPFFANRGCHIRILNEIQGLQSAGCRVILCTYGLGADVAGVELRRTWSIPGYSKTTAGFSLFKPLADIFLFFLVLRVVWRERVTIIHGHLHEGALIGWCVKLVLFWRRVSLIMDMQGSLSGELQAYGTVKNKGVLHSLIYALEKLIYRMPDKIICSSGAGVEFLSTVSPALDSQAELVGDVVPDRFFLAADKIEQRGKLNIPAGHEVIIYSGSLLAGKGVDVLLEALMQVTANNRECLFVLIGYPKEWVQQRVEQAGLADRFILPGEVAYFDLADWLAAADLAVDPKPLGSGEASGKILHYMAAGLPVVCFPTRNNRHFLGEQGFYAADESTGAFGRAVELALTDSESRLKYGAFGRRRARDDFSVESVGRQLQKIYRQLTL